MQHSAEWLGKRLVLLSSSWIHQPLYLYLSVCLLMLRLKTSLSSILFSLLHSGSYIIGFMFQHTELRPYRSHFSLPNRLLHKLKGRNCWKCGSCTLTFIVVELFWAGRKDRDQLWTGREEQHFGASQRYKNHILGSAYVHRLTSVIEPVLTPVI